jgi:hypothetical protein
VRFISLRILQLLGSSEPSAFFALSLSYYSTVAFACERTRVSYRFGVWLMFNFSHTADRGKLSI